MDTPAIAFGIFALLAGILLHKKRGKLTGGGRLAVPPAMLNRVISVLMFLGGTGLAATFIGDWLRGWDFSIAGLSSTVIVVIAACLLGLAVAIDVFDGNGLRPSTYGMITLLPLMWAAAGGSLAWPRAMSATAWTWLTGVL